MQTKRGLVIHSDDLDRLRERMPEATIAHLMILKTVESHMNGYCEWFACKRSDWNDLAMVSPFQYDRARIELQAAGLMTVRRGAVLGSSRQIMYHTTLKSPAEPSTRNTYRYKGDT